MEQKTEKPTYGANSQQELRNTFTEIREKLKAEMEKAKSSKIESQNKEKPALDNAFNVKTSIVRATTEDVKLNDIENIDECLKEALAAKRGILEARAKCIANGFPNAAKVYADALEKVSKFIFLYERRKNLGVDHD